MTRTLWRRAWAPVLAVAASLGLAMATSPAALAATSSTYYFKYFATSGTISPWYTNDSSWGVNAPSGTGFVAMVPGEDWGTWSPVHAIPKRLSAVGSGNTTWFSQSASRPPGPATTPPTTFLSTPPPPRPTATRSTRS